MIPLRLQIRAKADSLLALRDAFQANPKSFCFLPGSVDAPDNRYAKAVNFGLIYGMSSFELARFLGIDNSKSRRQ